VWGTLAGIVLAGGCGGCGGATEARTGPSPSATAPTTTTAKTGDSADQWVPGTGGTVTVGIDQAPTGCAPDSSSGDDWAERFVLAPVLPSAFVVTAGDKVVADSAIITQAEVVSTSPQTVVYTINPRAVWSDGVPVTDADFEYAWQQQRGSGPGATAGAAAPDPASTLGYRQIQSVTGSDGGRTVTVVFKTPFSDWQMLFSDMLPAHVMEKLGGIPPCTTVDRRVDLSAGPFEIAGIGRGGRVDLVRNPRWWGQKPDLSGITVRVADGPSQLGSWVGDGKIDVAEPSSYNPSFIEAVTGDPGLDSVDALSDTLVQLEFSTTAPVTADIRVRQALAYAVDRQDLVGSVVGWADARIVPAASHLRAQGQQGYPPPPTPGAVASGPTGSTTTTFPTPPTPSRPFPVTAEPTEEAALLTSAGYLQDKSGQWIDGSGKPLTLRVAVDDGDGWATSGGSVIAQQLRSAGIAVTVVPCPTADGAGRELAAGQVDAAVIPFESSPFPTQGIEWYSQVLGPAGTGGSQDWSNLDDPALDQLLVTASEQLNPVKAGPLYSQADAVLWKDMVTLPLFVEPTILVWSDKVAGVAANPSGPGLMWSPESWSRLVPPSSPDTLPG
jgi:peptide/nickel transport system substrate-binding protein